MMQRQTEESPGGDPGMPGSSTRPRILPGTLRQKAWLAMQIKRRFSLSDLVRNALPSGGTARAPRDNIGRYVRALCRVGVLVEMKRVDAGREGLRWALVRDLGRRAPVARINGEVLDPNSGEVLVAGAAGAEACHAGA